ncbi:hypothetical protein [Micromonospora sp. NPDC005324]|uniref:hypothetical protein n=1 Tax=Micromonospora sp. NPDC005324 TaxID=3157033 RepID=UPI0033B79149
MKHAFVLVIGLALLALGAQGAIRLLVDHDNSGLLSWMPGGFGVRLSCYVVAAAAGIALAAWGARRSKQTGSAR